MHRRRLLIPTLVFAAAILACGPATDLLSVTGDDPTAAPTAGPAAADEPDTTPATDPATLAVLGTDGNVYRITLADNAEPEAITSDASLDPQADELRYYEHPTWSPEGWLVFSQTYVQRGERPENVLFGLAPGGHIPQALTDLSQGFIYGYFAPNTCSDGPACATYAYLISEGGSVALYLADMVGGNNADAVIRSESRLALTGSSIYYAWEPDGSAFLSYQNGRDLAVYNADSLSLRRSFVEQPGFFQTPVWLNTVDDAYIIAERDNGMNELSLIEGDTRRTLARAIPGMAYFALSPDDSTLAYTHRAPGHLGNLRLVDVATGEVESLLIEDTFAFFFSPDSSKLAVVALESHSDLPESPNGVEARPPSQDGTVLFTWYIVDLATREFERIAPFLPTDEQFYIFSYFDQYANSHRLWSPDSQALVWVETNIDDTSPRVRVLTFDGDEPAIRTLMDGRQAIFSFR